MPKSVLIILAAVVLLIAVVVYLGLRYLRSDDEAEFDEVAREREPSRRGDVPAAQGGRRRRHDDIDPQRDLPRARGGRGDYYDDDRTELVPADLGSRAHPGGGRARAGSDTRHRRDSSATRYQPAVPSEVKSRSGKSKRGAEGDWPRNEWDELSDVDYWTELAADKPFSADAAADRPGPSGRRPSRGHDRGHDHASAGPRPATPARPVPGHSDPLRPDPAGRSGYPAPLDADPLTSPSFPRIAAEDSRSYRRRSGAHARPAVSPAPEYAAAPTQVPGEYRYTPSLPPGYQTPSVPTGYQMPANDTGGNRPRAGYEHDDRGPVADVQAPLGYGNYDAPEATGPDYGHREPAQGYADPLSPGGYAPHHRAGAGYSHSGQAESFHTYRQGRYAGADPYAVDPYGSY